jgi:hypothetical protein
MLPPLYHHSTTIMKPFYQRSTSILPPFYRHFETNTVIHTGKGVCEVSSPTEALSVTHRESCGGACGRSTECRRDVCEARKRANEVDLGAELGPGSPISLRSIKVGVCTQRGTLEVNFFTALAKACFPNAEVLLTPAGLFGGEQKSSDVMGRNWEGANGQGGFPAEMLFCWPNWHHVWPVMYAMGNATDITSPFAGTMTADHIQWPTRSYYNVVTMLLHCCYTRMQRTHMHTHTHTHTYAYAGR